MEDLVVVISLGLSVLTFYLGRMQGAKTEGEKQGILLNELENIKQDLQDLKADFKHINVEKIHAELNFLKSELTNCKENLYLTNQRIDNHLSKDHLLKVER